MSGRGHLTPQQSRLDGRDLPVALGLHEGPDLPVDVPAGADDPEGGAPVGHACGGVATYPTGLFEGCLGVTKIPLEDM